MSEDQQEEDIEYTEFDQEAQEKGAWAARGWDFEEEPEEDPELAAAIEELVSSMLRENENG